MHSLLLLCLTGSVAAQTVPFRSEVRTVLIPVSVTDESGKYVEGLKAGDFRVLDDGAPRPVSLDVFGLGAAPISLVIAIQTSKVPNPVAGKIQRVGSLIQPLVIGHRGEAAIVTFDYSIQWPLEFTKDSASRTRPELLLVRHFAELQGGCFNVKSEQRKGSRFSVSLPLGNSHLPADRLVTGSAAGASSSLGSLLGQAVAVTEDLIRANNAAADSEGWGGNENAPRSKRHILMSIESSELRHSCQGLLGEVYRVDSAAAGDEVLAALEREPADVFLADARAEVWSILRAIRSRPETAQISIIVLSVHDSAEERLRALSEGADDFLAAPFMIHELLAHIESQAALAELRRQHTARDRAARENAESRLRVLEKVLDFLPMGVAIAECATGQITHKNRKLLQMMGERIAALRSVYEIRDGMAFRSDGAPISRDECAIVRSTMFGERLRMKFRSISTIMTARCTRESTHILSGTTTASSLWPL